MVRKIGNWFIIFLVLQMGFASLCNADSSNIRLLAKTINGDSLTEAVIGVPFLLEVHVQSSDTIPGTPHITGMQHMHIEDKGHVSTINSIVNGVRSTKKIFQYRVRVAAIGMYTVGPALLVNNKKRLQSNSLTLNVVQQETVHKKTEPFLKMVVEKKNVVVGEPIPFSLRFYPLNSANLEGLSDAKFPNFSAAKLDGPFTGQEEIEGDNYQYIEWKTILYPKKSGSMTIPAIAAIYRQQRGRRHRGFELFDMIHGSFDKKQIFSNAVTIEVEDLPPHNGSFGGVGAFTKLAAQIDHAKAKEGEGCVYSLILDGNGDLESIQSPELLMPEGLKYYESKSYVKGGSQKVFEYIIQGMKSGSWQIPKQTFTYFDLGSRSYKELSSNAIDLTIIPEEKRINDISQEQKQLANNDDTSVIKINTEGPWQEKRERSIPALLFIFLLSIPVIFVLYRFIRFSHHDYLQKNGDYLKRKHAFKNAYATYKKAKQENNKQLLYGMFIQLFADRGAIKHAELSQDEIDRYLERQNFSPEERMAWQKFFGTLVHHKFFLQSDSDDTLFDHARFWLKRLENCL